jgi:hypothetical protein
MGGDGAGSRPGILVLLGGIHLISGTQHERAFALFTASCRIRSA